jgi:hypothetical protein
VGVRQFWVQRPKPQQNECYRHGRDAPEIWPGSGLVNGVAREAETAIFAAESAHHAKAGEHASEGGRATAGKLENCHLLPPANFRNWLGQAGCDGSQNFQKSPATRRGTMILTEFRVAKAP